VGFELEKIWAQLESESEEFSESQRIYRRLDLKRETGLRISLQLPNKIREVLIEVDNSEENLDIESPMWRGMQLEKIILGIPSDNSIHIRLSLKNSHLSDVFTTVCNDLCVSLSECSSPVQRREELLLFLDRWSRFFRSQGPDGLPQSRQQGLFGEIWWLEKMLHQGVNALNAVKSWKGCQRNYHDFELSGHVVEVKTTKSKEPRKVWVNNERQLDNRGIAGLFLFILSLHLVEGDALTLPNLVERLRLTLNDHKAALHIFERDLISVGYLNIHAVNYIDGYLVKSQELFEVRDSFPCITRLPQGTGDLRYSLVVSSCRNYQVPEDLFFNFINRGQQNG